MDSLKTIQSDFYGDNVRWFVGIVESNYDPMRRGRVQVRIFGIHSPNTSEVRLADLPWAQVVVPTTEPGVSGLGATPSIGIGAQVFGLFLDGKQSQIPLVIGTMPRIERGTPPLTETRRPNENVDPVVLPNQNLAEQPNFDTSGAVGSSNAERSFNYFVSVGYTPEQSAGIIGNLIQESNLNPTIVSSFEGEGSFGIAQWNPAEAAGNRKGLLEAFASENNLDYNLLETQLAFIDYELKNYPYLGLSQLRAAGTPEDAARIFSSLYERPSQEHANNEARQRYARDIYEEYYNGL